MLMQKNKIGFIVYQHRIFYIQNILGLLCPAIEMAHC